MPTALERFLLCVPMCQRKYCSYSNGILFSGFCRKQNNPNCKVLSLCQNKPFQSKHTQIYKVLQRNVASSFLKFVQHPSRGWMKSCIVASWWQIRNETVSVRDTVIILRIPVPCTKSSMRSSKSEGENILEWSFNSKGVFLAIIYPKSISHPWEVLIWEWSYSW